MATKKQDSNKPVLERTYNVPLREGWLKAPKYRRSKKAVNTLKEFLSKHMKSDNLKLGKHLNEQIWARGIKNPPHHVNINVAKYADGMVKAELVGKPLEEVAKKPEAKEEKKAAPKSQEPKVPGKLETKSPTKEEAPKASEKKPAKEAKPAEKKEEKKSEEKKEEKPKAEKKEQKPKTEVKQ